ncbi:hypothetical protein [Sphaerisporangium fuscum]|uniref:hypothetical protein n=1 Tax=Sphaerisporangium fuscum TaxID=2835868 RepID=UPI001BDD32D3|nr:hypothetical protein [Sphaerisporangium fuscum]
MRKPLLRLLAGAAASAVCCGVFVPLPANATAERPRNERTVRDDDPGKEGRKTQARDGNGTGNRSATAVDSPTNQSGIQHTSNSNMGGSTSIQNALCKRVKNCHITLKVVIVQPGKVKKTQHVKTVDSPPRKHEPPAAPEEETSGPEDDCGC